MNFFIWNARGANSTTFIRQCQALVKMHKPTMMVLLEIKMAEHRRITEDLGFDAQI